MLLLVLNRLQESSVVYIFFAARSQCDGDSITLPIIFQF